MPLKRIVLFITLSLCVCINPAVAKDLRILFIGNSYIFMNDLPKVLQSMMEADGNHPQIETMAYPGWTLSQHARSTKTIEKIQSQSWDYVVLQEQSTLPLNELKRRGRMIPAIRYLDEVIQERGAKTLLFMTWGRRDGFASMGFRNFGHMQEELDIAYKEAARSVGISVVPVGNAWLEARRQKPYYPLWEDDGSHPSIFGTYLSACVFYNVLTGQDVLENTYEPDLTLEMIDFLKSVSAPPGL